MKCRLRRGDLQHSKEHLALGNDLEDASVCQRSLWDHTPPWQRIRHLQERPHHNRGQLQSLAAWTIQWRVNSPSCCWTAMKSKKLTCLEFCNAICLAGFFERFTHWMLDCCKRATKGWGAKLSMFLTVANCWIERLRKGRIAATWWASLAPTSSSVHLFATNKWVYQTSTPNTTMHQISTNHLCNTCCQSHRTTASQHCLQTCFTLPSFHHKMKHNQTILSCSAVALLHVISLPHDPFAKNLPEQNMQGSKQA